MDGIDYHDDDVNRRPVLALIERICASATTTALYVNRHAEDRIPGIERRLELGARLSASA